MNAELRCILCLDIDCFFAQVLLKDRPDLKDKHSNDYDVKFTVLPAVNFFATLFFCFF